MASAIWLRMVKTGFSDVPGSWKNVGDAPAAELAQLVGLHLQHFLPVEEDFT